jgi:hypothetical protein
VNFRDKMPGDSISNFKLFPSDDESSPSSEPPAKDKDPPYDPRFNSAIWSSFISCLSVAYQISKFECAMKKICLEFSSVADPVSLSLAFLADPNLGGPKFTVPDPEHC